VAAAKAFLKQHLQQQPQQGATAGEEAPPHKKKKKESKKHRKSSDSEAEDDGGGVNRLPPGVLPIEADSYYEKSAEFTAWLLQSKGVYFNGKAVGQET
jgi:hypothetical protein